MMFQQDYFKGQVAIITGAGAGIGLEIAMRLASLGAHVVLNDISMAKADKAIQQLSTKGVKCLAVAGDVGVPEVVDQLIEKAVDEFGRIDMAIANAGITLYGDFFEYSLHNFQRVMQVNLQASFYLAQQAAIQMKKQGSGGRILFTSSVTGHQAHKYLSVYGMSKAALEMLAKSLVIELSPYGIGINCLAPGATITERTLADDPKYPEVWKHLTPTGRASTPSDIANAALFLLSPDNSQITGQTLIVDGGWTAVSPSPSLDFVEKS